MPPDRPEPVLRRHADHDPVLGDEESDDEEDGQQ
jgi:hypothetical protein